MKRFFTDIINDTLKKKDRENYRWSRTSLTMFSSWIIACAMAIENYCKHGIRYDIWITLICVALGTKVSDALAQKLNK